MNLIKFIDAAGLDLIVSPNMRSMCRLRKITLPDKVSSFPILLDSRLCHISAGTSAERMDWHC
jgi:hypothetical protein